MFCVEPMTKKKKKRKTFFFRFTPLGFGHCRCLLQADQQNSPAPSCFKLANSELTFFPSHFTGVDVITFIFINVRILRSPCKTCVAPQGPRFCKKNKESELLGKQSGRCVFYEKNSRLQMRRRSISTVHLRGLRYWLLFLAVLILKQDVNPHWSVV